MERIIKEPNSTRNLKHFGILGMRWGVRKEYQNTDGSLTPLGSELLKKSPTTKGFILKKDGSMVAPKGTNFQRLTYSSGVSRGLKDISYLSVSDYDNARYIKELGGKKGFLSAAGRDQILNIKTTKTIKAPSLEEATRIHSTLLLSNQEFNQKVRTYLTEEKLSKRELEEIRKNPTGKTAEKWYRETNIMLAADAEWDKNAPYIRETFKKTMLSKGWNGLRDENDAYNGIAKSPVIVFNPENSLRVTRMSQITDALREANEAKLKAYSAVGEKWIEEQMYNR